MPNWPSSLGTISLHHFFLLFIFVAIFCFSPSNARNNSPSLSPSSLLLESQLDSNRSAVVNGERIFVPRQIPKMSRADKRRLILEQFRREGLLPPDKLFAIEWTMRASKPNGRRQREQQQQKKRREINGTPRAATERPWRKHYVVRRQYRPRINRIMTARNTEACPTRLDAVTEGFNRRLYLFAGELVYEVWRDSDGLQQKRAYPIVELFPDGPRTVKAAMTNQKSGITLLVDWRQVYRYRWNRRHKRFYLARNSPRDLPSQVDFLPAIGFQWKDGHLILANKDKFVSYDPYWNLATFTSPKVADYFPNLAMDRLVGVVKHGRDSILWMTGDGRVQMYDLEKHRMGMEMPLNLPKLVACLQHRANATMMAPMKMT